MCRILKNTRQRQFVTLCGVGSKFVTVGEQQINIKANNAFKSENNTFLKHMTLGSIKKELLDEYALRSHREHLTETQQGKQLPDVTEPEG
jgi:hypothetical protein